jgi:hypothetical protein
VTRVGHQERDGRGGDQQQLDHAVTDDGGGSALGASLVDGAVNNIVPARPGWMFVSTWNAAAGSEAAEYAVWAWAAARESYPATG